MHLQPRLPVLPDDAKSVGTEIAVTHSDGVLTFWNASGPIYQCDEDDTAGLRRATVMFTGLGLAQQKALSEVLGVHRNTALRWQKKFEEEGPAGLEPVKRGPRGGHKLQGERLAEAQRHLDDGRSNREVAKRVGVSEGAIRNAMKNGRLVRREIESVERPGEEGLTSPAARSREDALGEAGVAVKRQMDRLLASQGEIAEARPEFTAAEAVGKAGVLVALPAVLRQGLVEVGEEVYGSLKNGYFGLKSMLLTFVFMALLRIKTIEDLSSHAPGEFGLILGLDRAPEMKTARRKLAEMGERRLGSELRARLAERWAEAEPEELGFLYVDGHVRPYNGRKHKLPKTHVQRRRLCMPATTDHWVNGASSDPLFYFTAPANDGLLSMLEQEVLPEVRRLVGPDRRVTLVFDREGWSPDSFKRWHEEGFDVLTYRKGKYEAWPEECFFEVKVRVGRKDITYRLGQRSVPIRKGFWMREVRRLCDDGHQTSVMTTRQDLEIEDVALRMFARWSQENFFRYMRREFDLDHVPTTAVEPANPNRRVPNPERKAKKKELTKVQAELAKEEREYGEAALGNPEARRRTMRGFKIAHAETGKRIRELRERCASLKVEIAELPERVPLREIMERHEIVRLEQERKSILDAVKMVAYRAETELATLVAPLLPYREDEARGFLRDVFSLSADLLPDPSEHTLRVRLHTMSTPRENRALHALCEILTERAACYPGTDLQMVFEPPPLPQDF